MAAMGPTRTSKVPYERHPRGFCADRTLTVSAGPPWVFTGGSTFWHQVRAAEVTVDGSDVTFVDYWCGGHVTLNERVRKRGVRHADLPPDGELACRPCGRAAAKAVRGRALTAASMKSADLETFVTLRAWCANGEAKRIRKAAGLSMAELASLVGTTGTTVCRWERGDRVIRNAYTASRYHDALIRLRGLVEAAR